ncbi:chromate efflux transporter [Arcobacter sp. FWKO B]|uniref:chromate efflux transporter n=1 Tax=Arcobacter sp. FWKO B TaxID=2593672 RepID=UPI0018A69E19|nr:chromate efflux transporter [Arcobacter sp. FWKO B]QOG12763.1 chromate efflux transporter [Arcobacter sp. FWKO B]
MFEIFWRFLILGLVSFGGPVAHIGYFQKTFVDELKWISQESYTKLVAFTQILPGPSSSQVGFAIGLKRGGVFGAILAFIGFTLPSFLLMYFAVTIGIFDSNSILFGVVTGLKLFAVVVVADAIITMYKNFCKTTLSIAIALLSALFLVLFSNITATIFALIFFAIVGIMFIKSEKTQEDVNPHKKINYIYLSLFIIIFILLGIFGVYSDIAKFINAFYSSGSLVFGGGHVVLPFLQEFLKEFISNDSFLVGYALAQSVPGPMFSFASYLGADILASSPFLGALIATITIFLPGFLLVLAFYDSWEYYSSKKYVFGAIAGINATVVGLLISAFISPVFTSAIFDFFDLFLVILGLVILRRYKIKILYLLGLFCLVGVVL